METNKSFHTTQYDLNAIDYILCGLFCMFPYYIVRFKPGCSTDAIRCANKFPYYIVRFKLASFFLFSMRLSGFHTTQYDLNTTFSNIWMNDQKSFHTTQYDLNPFYIFQILVFPSSFHTTQYDLNYFIFLVFLHFLYLVSILHSTI